MCWNALHTLWILLCNVCISISCAWLANLCMSSGNIFATKSLREQSNTEFATATIVWTHTFNCAVVVLAQAPMLLPLRFERYPAYAPTFGFCLWKVMKHAYPSYVGSLLFTICIHLLLDTTASQVVANRLGLYVGLTCNHICSVGIFVSVRDIVRRETVQGQARSQSFRRQRTLCGSMAHFCKAYLRTSPMLLTIMSAAVYVRIASQFRFQETHQVAAFTLGSLALKLFVQEVAKVGLLKWKIEDVRTVFFAVGLPTVLIDTQVRIALQRVNSTQGTLNGTLALATLEIATRAGKAALVHLQIRRRERKAALAQQWEVTGITTTTKIVPAQSRTDASERASSLTNQASLERWKTKISTFHVAELYADMSAEYIAIGCSTSILYFYWDHPKYELGGADGAATMPSHWQQSVTLSIQVAVEVCVDYLSCVFEIGRGVDFEQVRRYRVFLCTLFVGIAVVNIHISATTFILAW